MNAAVSLTMCAFGRLAWKMLPLYVVAQFLGSFLAAGTVYAVYYGETCSVPYASLLRCFCVPSFQHCFHLQKPYMLTVEGT